MTPARTPNKPPAFVAKQLEFAAHVRNPEHNPLPNDVEDRRMGIYRELFYNNVEDFMASSFPVMRKLFDDERWHAMIRDYFAHHKAHTPLFPEMPREFLKYLESERKPDPNDPPFLSELAHYEWVELALSLADEELPDTSEYAEGDLLDGIPVLSPLAWLLSYEFPVHRIGPDFQPETPEAQPTYLVVYRDRKDEIGFIELNPVTARLLQLISENEDKTGRELMEMIAAELRHPNPATVVQGGQSILRDLVERTVLLGARKPR
ncbi:MAG: hypothetical protein AMS22_01100 [Thiotrichales bacterium SG8_50]|nr:MAG: hypothetical protein AMS22_01100 [Thiotrichales bacterium SG8_50]